MGLAFGGLLAVVHLAALSAIKGSLGFLGSWATPMLGVILALVGAGVLFKAKFMQIPGGLGIALVGAGIAAEGLSAFGFFGGVGVGLSALGLALIVTQYALKSGVLARFGIKSPV